MFLYEAILCNIVSLNIQYFNILNLCILENNKKIFRNISYK